MGSLSTWGVLIMGLIPLGQLWARIFNFNGSLDKWWLMFPLFLIPPFSFIPLILMKMGFVSTEFFVASRTLSACNLGDRFGLNQILEPADLVTLPLIMDKINPLIREMFKEIVDNIHKDVSSSVIRNGN